MSHFTDISAIYTDRVSFSSFELFTSPCVISYTLYLIYKAWSAVFYCPLTLISGFLSVIRAKQALCFVEFSGRNGFHRNYE